MNKLIQELADQCWDEYPNTGPVVFNKEKFAELIVQECMGVVSKKCASATAYNALVEHFGVEE